MVLTSEAGKEPNDVGDTVSEFHAPSGVCGLITGSSSDSKRVGLRVGTERTGSGVTGDGVRAHCGTFGSNIADPDVHSTLLGLAVSSGTENGS